MRIFSLMMAAMLLTGCFIDAEPTASEIDEAMKKKFASLGFLRSEKIACVPAKEKPGFSCDVSVTYEHYGLTRREYSGNESHRFVKTEKDWEMVQ